MKKKSFILANPYLVSKSNTNKYPANVVCVFYGEPIPKVTWKICGNSAQVFNSLVKINTEINEDNETVNTMNITSAPTIEYYQVNCIAINGGTKVQNITINASIAIETTITDHCTICF